MRSCKPQQMCAEFDIQFRELMRLDKSFSLVPGSKNYSSLETAKELYL